MAKKKTSKGKPNKKRPSAKAKPVKKKAKKVAPKKKAKASPKKVKAKAKPVKKKKPVKKAAKKTAKKVVKKALKKIAPKKAAPVKKISKPVPAKIVKTKPEPVVLQPMNIPPPKPQPVKRIKRAPYPPAEPKEPLVKVVKTFSLKPTSKEKNAPVHPNQYSIEYIVHASATLLFEVISSPSGLSEWFADDVNIRDGNFTFFWDGSTQVAQQIAYKQDKLVRFHWEGKPDYTFFEFRIETDDLTNDTSLIITDFTEDGDKESARLLWDNQINRLRKSIGS